jgi:hypothetical protein
MFFTMSECALFSRKPSRVLEHFWWTSQWLQGLATYTDQVRASKFLLAILCLRQWHGNFFFFFTVVHYEQNRLLYSPWFLCWAELLLVTGIHPDHCASTVSHSSFESLWIQVLCPFSWLNLQITCRKNVTEKSNTYFVALPISYRNVTGVISTWIWTSLVSILFH